MLPWPSRVLVTNPDRQLPCHFSKTVLRIPSTWTHPAKIHIRQRYEKQSVPHRERSVFFTGGMMSLFCLPCGKLAFENTALSAACNKTRGKLWPKERELDGASPLDKVLLRNVVPSRFCPGFKKGLHSVIYHAIMLPEIESRIFRAGCDSLPVVQPTSRKA